MMILSAFALAITSVGSIDVRGSVPPPNASIRLERTACFGSCPVYTVTIDGRGTVAYDGQMYVRASGRHTTRLPAAAVAKLVTMIERIHFFDLQDTYTQIKTSDGRVWIVNDLPTTIITATVDGRTKRVVSYLGAPESFVELEREIDATAGTKRWIFLDERALSELLRSGWRASTDEGARFLRQAVQRDDISIARMLITAGVSLNGPSDNPGPPLGGAKSASMVELLVKAGADVNKRRVDGQTGKTALMDTAHRDASVAEALIKAGARLEDQDHGFTALGYVACAGNWRVATVLLKAGAHPRGGSNDLSAADCAREGRRDAMNRRGLPAVLAREMPSVEDFDLTIALLESAQKRAERVRR